MESPETQFAFLGGDRIAYQVFGEGDLDLLYLSATGDPIELRWDWPPYARFLRGLGPCARVVMFDRRGSASSDSASGEPLPSWERWVGESLTVLDALASERAVVLGNADAAVVAVTLAAGSSWAKPGPHRCKQPRVVGGCSQLGGCPGVVSNHGGVSGGGVGNRGVRESSDAGRVPRSCVSALGGA